MSAAVMTRGRVPNAVLGVALLLFTEVMLFCGLVSAYLVLRSGAGAWPPPGQPRLPVVATALTSTFLLASGVVLWRNAAKHRGLALGLGGVFVLVQGFEWVALVAHATAGLYGALFTIIIGCHGLHAIAGLLALAFAGAGEDGLRAVRLYWTFVVAVWPPLYVLVYLW